MTKGIKFPSV